MKVEFINPFLSSAQNVFSTMLGCALVRGPLSVKLRAHSDARNQWPDRLEWAMPRDVRGELRPRDRACAAELMLGTRPEELNSDVMDAIGELTNMIAGGAKTQLEEYRLTIGLPTVICGKSQIISFPSQAAPIVIPFDSDIGPVCVQVGLVEGPAV